VDRDCVAILRFGLAVLDVVLDFDLEAGFGCKDGDGGEEGEEGGGEEVETHCG